MTSICITYAISFLVYFVCTHVIIILYNFTYHNQTYGLMLGWWMSWSKLCLSVCCLLRGWTNCLQSEIAYHLLRPGHSGGFLGWRRMSSLLFSAATPVAENVRSSLFFVSLQLMHNFLQVEFYCLLHEYGVDNAAEENKKCLFSNFMLWLLSARASEQYNFAATKFSLSSLQVDLYIIAVSQLCLHNFIGQFSYFFFCVVLCIISIIIVWKQCHSWRQ